MGLLAYVIVGAVAGFLAKMVMPGNRNEPSGLIGTIVLGIVGAVIGGWAWNMFLNRPGARGVDIGSIFVAFVGSLIVIGILRLVTNNRSAASGR